MSGLAHRFPSTDPDLDGLDWLRVRYEGFLKHDRWDEACTNYCKDILSSLDASPYMSKITSTEARYMACNSIISLYFSKKIQGQEGLTLSEVQEAALEGSQLGSRNRVAGLINTMVFAGVATVEQCDIDRRQRIFKLTDFGKAAVRAYRLSVMAKIDDLEGSNWVERIDADLLLASRIYESVVSTYNQSGRPSQIFAPFASIIKRTFGIELFYTIWVEVNKTGKSEPARIVLPYHEIAQRRGVSRAHMRLLIEDCKSAGLLEITKPGGKELQILPAFLELYRKFAAVQFSLIVIGVERAAADL